MKTILLFSIAAMIFLACGSKTGKAISDTDSLAVNSINGSVVDKHSEARDIKFEELDVEKGTALVDYKLYSSVQTVHQKLRFCREDGDWRVHDIIRFYNDSDGKEVQSSLMESMRNYLAEPQEETSELTYANMDGIYDSLDENMSSVSRISLNADGTATWLR